MRLRNRTRPLRKLVEFRGREHLEAARAAGKGAILCTAHFGSYVSAFSLIHASGVPVPEIGHWWWNYDPSVSPAVRRSGTSPMPGACCGTGRARTSSRGRAGSCPACRQSVRCAVTRWWPYCPMPPRRRVMSPALVEVPFLGGEATFVPGVVHLARSSGAPVLMVSVYRSADYRHQVVEISPPLSLEGEPQEAFARCAAAMDATIRTNPARGPTGRTPSCLASLGLIPATALPRSAVVA